MSTAYRHGDGVVVHVFLEDVIVFIKAGVIVSSDRALTHDERKTIEARIRDHPPRSGTLTTRQIKASMRVPYDKDEHSDDCSLGSEDTWSEEEEEEEDEEED